MDTLKEIKAKLATARFRKSRIEDELIALEKKKENLLGEQMGVSLAIDLLIDLRNQLDTGAQPGGEG